MTESYIMRLALKVIVKVGRITFIKTKKANLVDYVMAEKSVK